MSALRRLSTGGAIVLLLLIISMGQSRADTLTHHVSLQSFSYHFQKADERRGSHPGLGYEFSPFERLGFQGGTFVDSFGYQATYAGLNYSMFEFSLLGKSSRIILSASMMNKIYTKGGEPDTRFVPMPILETQLYKRLSINLTGSPEMDYYDGKHTNGVLFVQFKLGVK